MNGCPRKVGTKPIIPSIISLSYSFLFYTSNWKHNGNIKFLVLFYTKLSKMIIYLFILKSTSYSFFSFIVLKKKKHWEATSLSEPSFDPDTYGLWAHHASTTPLWLLLQFLELMLFILMNVSSLYIYIYIFLVRKKLFNLFLY